MRERLPGIYEVELKSEYHTVDGVSVYLVPSENRCLMVDAGLRNQGSLEAVLGALETLCVTPDRLDVFLTHDHHDHTGLAPALADRGARVYMNPEEKDHGYDCLHYTPGLEAERRRVLGYAGLTPKGTPKLWERVLRYDAASNPELEVPSFLFSDSRSREEWAYGGYCFKSIPLCGHTYGQLGLYDPSSQVLFCGDQVLRGISPIVGTSYKDDRLLARYFKSLEYIKHHFIGWHIFPAHNGPVEDLASTVDRIVFSYLDKVYTIQQVLVHSGRRMTAREAAQVAYGLPGLPESAQEFLKFKMVTVKTFSCLEYLYEEDFAVRSEENGVLFWEAP